MKEIRILPPLEEAQSEEAKLSFKVICNWYNKMKVKQIDHLPFDAFIATSFDIGISSQNTMQFSTWTDQSSLATFDVIWYSGQKFDPQHIISQFQISN